MEGRKKDVKYWISQFNSLRKTITIDKWSFGNHVEFMDLYIYKGDKFYTSGILDFKIFQKDINRLRIKVVMFPTPLKTTC